MALIKEPLNVDFAVYPSVLTDTEKLAITAYIRTYKAKKVVKNKISQTIDKQIVADNTQSVQ